MKTRIVFALGILFAVSVANALDTANMTLRQQQELIASKVPPAKPEDVVPVGVGELFEVKVGEGRYVYVTKDARFMVAGDLYDLNGLKNMSETRRAETRRVLLDSLQDSELITFDARGTGRPRHSIIVFTDPDCAYCIKLHGEIDQLTELGIQVKYAAYPRSGPETDAWRKAEMVWCAKDRAAALTAAKSGKSFSSSPCSSPVRKHYDLATRMGIRGTPMIVTSNGESVGGYLPPVMLLDRLEKLSTEAAASMHPSAAKSAGKR